MCANVATLEVLVSPMPTAKASFCCRSPVHRVVTTGVERTSFGFFYYPDFDAALHVESQRPEHGSTGEFRMSLDSLC